MKYMLGVLVTVAMACTMAGCGSGTASGSTRTTEASSRRQSVEDPTEGGTRRAGEGVACDYGGAADRTCQVGLYCCYGPPDDPGEHGQCMPECPEY